MRIREAYPLHGQTIYIRGLDFSRPVATEITVAEIVRIDQNDIGILSLPFSIPSDCVSSHSTLHQHFLKTFCHETCLLGISKNQIIRLIRVCFQVVELWCFITWFRRHPASIASTWNINPIAFSQRRMRSFMGLQDHFIAG